MFNVMILDDDLMVCSILEKQIGRFQQLKLTASFQRGSDALEYLRDSTHTIDLIVLDNYMPNMTGIEFLAKLRETNKEIQVIMITSANDYSVVRAAMCLGICDYVLKPFSNSRFDKAISKFDTVMKLKAETDVWTQDRIDALMCPHKHYITENLDGSHGAKGKKINAVTLAGVRKYMRRHKGEKMPLTAISEGLDLSTVTVRRYLKHLNSLGEVKITLDCKTGGRPSEIFEYTDDVK